MYFNVYFFTIFSEVFLRAKLCQKISIFCHFWIKVFFQSFFPCKEWSVIPGLPDFYRYSKPKWGNIYQITRKYTRCPQNMANGRKIDQMAAKYTNIFYCKTLENLPKFGFFVWKYTIWQPCVIQSEQREWRQCLKSNLEKEKKRTEKRNWARQC
jgi:hypothetical protein